MNHPDRILIVRPSALGDVFRSVPLAVSIGRAFPESSVDWVVQTEFVDAVRGHPSIDRIVAFPRNELRGWWKSPSGWARLRSFVSSIRGRYDLVLDAQGLGRSGFISLASGGLRRIGFADAREFGWLGLNERVRTAAGLSAVDRMLELLRGAGIEPVRDLSLYVPSDVESDWSAWKSRAFGSASFAVIAPTSRWHSKEWPLDRWTSLTRELTARGLNVLVLGSPQERSRLAGFESLGADVRVLAGEGPLAWSMAAVRDAELVVANDSAMLHAAAGFGRRLVGLFGPTDPRVCGPYERCEDCIRADDVPEGVHYRQRDLGDRLMRQISVECVVAACVDRLDAPLGVAR